MSDHAPGDDDHDADPEHDHERERVFPQDSATMSAGPERAVGVTPEVYDGLLWLADNRAEVDALDHQYPESPDAAATVLYENNHDGAAAWVTAHANKYRRGRLEGFYVQKLATPGSGRDPDLALDQTTEPPEDTPRVTDRPSPRADLLAEFLSAPEEWHATAAGLAIGYAIYTPDPTLVAFAFTLVGLDMATTAKWEGNEKLIREMRAEYQYAIFGAMLGVGLGLLHLSAAGGEAAIAGTVTDIAADATATATASTTTPLAADIGGPVVFWVVIFAAIAFAAVVGTLLVYITLRLGGLVP